MSKILAVKAAKAIVLTLSDGKQITTAIRKHSVSHIRVERLGPVGDEVANVKHHGGVDKAIFFNGQKSLEKLTALLALSYDYLQDSRFGENFVVSDLDENNVCIGDQFRIGEALIEVCQPRKPCNTLSQNTNVPETRKVVVETGLVGWYARVLEAGEIHQDDELVLVKRPYPALTVMAVHELLSKPANTLNKTFLEQTLQCNVLAEGYKITLRKQADKLAQDSSQSAFFNTPEF